MQAWIRTIEQIDAGVVPEPDRDQQNLYIVGSAHFRLRGLRFPFVGEHNYYTRHGQRIRFAWTADSASLAQATRIISHELVEALTGRKVTDPRRPGNLRPGRMVRDRRHLLRPDRPRCCRRALLVEPGRRLHRARPGQRLNRFGRVRIAGYAPIIVILAGEPGVRAG